MKRMKQSFAMILAIIMIVCMMPMSAITGDNTGSIFPKANAASTVTVSNRASKLQFLTSIEQHSESSARKIYTPNDLINMKNYLSGTYILMNDIDMSGINWTPIGTSQDNAFKGNFYGNGHTIKNLTITGNYTEDVSLGLFAYVGGESYYGDRMVIRDIKLENVNFNVSSSAVIYAGAFFGHGYAHWAHYNIRNCIAEGSITVTSSNKAYIGGIAGHMRELRVYHCINAIDINTRSSSVSEVGGLIAYVDQGGVYNSCNYGNLTTYTSYGINNTAGLVAGFDGGSGTSTGASKIYHSFNVGNIDATSNSWYVYAGGLVGEMGDGGLYHPGIQYCFNAGNVSATVKSPSSSIANQNGAYCGGIVGCTDGTVENVYNVGDIQSKSGTLINKAAGDVFGRVYLSDYGVTNKDIYLINNSIPHNGLIQKASYPRGSVKETNVVDLDLMSMCLPQNYSAFDFTNVWGKTRGYPFPTLKGTPLIADLYSGATVMLNNFNSDFCVVSYGTLEILPDARVDYSNQHLEIDYQGYYHTNITDCTLEEDYPIFVAAIPVETGCHITAVHCNGIDALVDANRVEFPIKGDSTTDNEQDVIINIYTDLSDCSKYQLLYDGTVLAESETGRFELKAKDITTGHSLKARVVDKQGQKYSPIDTNIKTYNTTTTFGLKDNKFNITFPEDMKIIGGWNFDLDLSSLPVFVLKDEDTIRIGMGFSKNSKFDKLTSDIHDGENTTSYWDKDGTTRSLWFDWKQAVKKTKQDIIENTALTTIAEKTTDFSSLGCSLVGSELSPVKVDAKAAFYLELKYKDGKWSKVGADGFISISASMSWSTFMLVFYVPVEFKVEGKVGASADVSVLYDTEKSSWDFSGTLDMTLPSLTGSAPIGIPKVLNGGGYVNLTNKVKVNMWDNIKGTLSGELGVQGQFVIFSGSRSLWKFLDWEYLNKDFGNGSKQSTKKKALQLSDVDYTDEVFDESAYSLDTRAYLENQSSWLGGSSSNSDIRKAPAKGLSNTSKLLQSSIYQDADPQIIRADDGTTMMVWTADMPERSIGNQTAIVYSVYDEIADSWSEPAVIYDDGTADAYADVTTDGNDIYVSWMNTNTVFDENVTIDEFAAACEISVAKFDKTSGTFDNVQNITNNDNFDFMPALYASEGDIYIAYVQNSDNSPLTMSGTNKVIIARMNGDAIDTVLEKSIENPVESLDVYVSNDNLTAAIIVDGDGNMQTTEDVEIYLLDASGTLTQYTDNDAYESCARFSSVNDATALTYYSENGIHYTYDFDNETVITAENGVNVSADYLFIDDAEGTILLTKTNMGSSDKTNIYANVWDEGTWIGDAQITDCDYDLKAFSACRASDGTLRIVYTTAQYETEITEDNGDGSSTGTYTENVDLYASEYQRTTDIELIAVDYEDNTINPGQAFPVVLILKNNGLKTISDVTISSDYMGDNNSVALDVALKPGQTTEIEHLISVPSSFNSLTDITLTVTCENDSSSENNSRTIAIGYTDLTASINKISSLGLTSAGLTIANNSCIDTDAMVRLYKDNFEGQLLAEYIVLDIPAFSNRVFYLSNDVLSSNYDYGDTVCVEVIATKDEKYTGDNRDFFTIDTPETDLYSYTVLADNKIRIDKYNGTDTNLVIPETYDDYTVSSLAANVVPSFVTSITLPSGLETVTSTAFNSATGLTEINVSENNQVFTSKNGILYSADGTKVIRCPIAIENKTLVLPNDVIEINDHAFANVGLTSVVLPESLQMIRSYAFSNNNIVTITIPEAVTRIERNSFEKCSNLAEINYNAVNAETGISATGFLAQYLIRSYAVFASDTTVQTINIGESVQSLSSGLFANLSALKTVNIATDNHLVSIAAYTFLSDSALSDVYYGRYYKYWKQITIADGNTPITNATLHCVECEECTWDDGVITTTATCITTGEKLFTCTVCEKERTEVVAIDPNNHVGDTSVINQKDSTCTQEGYNGDTICSDCNVVLESGTTIPKKDHTWNSGTVTQPTTCTESGIKTFNCINCTATRTESIDALGHEVSTEWTIDKEPTCTKSGSKSHHCSRCDFTTDITVIDVLGHSWDQGEITTSATCTETGIRTYTCSVCGVTKTATINAGGHKYGSWTKLNDNQHQRICENDSSHIEKENHSWNDGTVTKTATCTEAGIRTFTCTVCGAKKTESIKATGHNYGAWTIVKAPSCTAEGVEQRVCDNDNKHVETRSIEKIAHVDNDGDGYCDNCHTDLGSGGETHESNCVCGKYHTGPFAGIIKFFHRIVYFFKNLFGKN